MSDLPSLGHTPLKLLASSSTQLRTSVSTSQPRRCCCCRSEGWGQWSYSSHPVQCLFSINQVRRSTLVLASVSMLDIIPNTNWYFPRSTWRSISSPVLFPSLNILEIEWRAEVGEASPRSLYFFCLGSVLLTALTLHPYPLTPLRCLQCCSLKSLKNSKVN